MAADKVSLLNKIRRSDILLAEADMRSGHRTRFFGVVNKVTLGEVICFLADNLHRFFVCAYSTVGTLTVEHSIV